MKNLGVIKIPNALNSEFDHAAFDPRPRRVFIAHTARNCIEVIDHDAQKHIVTLAGFPGVADDGDRRSRPSLRDFLCVISLSSAECSCSQIPDRRVKDGG